MNILANYIYNIGVALSQLANALIGGDPDESLSGRMGKRIKRDGRMGWPKWLHHHFIRSIEADEGDNSAWKRKERP